jgi:hypothetical protein
MKGIMIMKNKWLIIRFEILDWIFSFFLVFSIVVCLPFIILYGLNHSIKLSLEKLGDLIGAFFNWLHAKRIEEMIKVNKVI